MQVFGVFMSLPLTLSGNNIMIKSLKCRITLQRNEAGQHNHLLSLILVFLLHPVEKKNQLITCTGRPWAAPESGDLTANSWQAYHQEARVAVKSAGWVQCAVSSGAAEVSVIRHRQRVAFDNWGHKHPQAYLGHTRVSSCLLLNRRRLC